MALSIRNPRAEKLARQVAAEKVEKALPTRSSMHLRSSWNGLEGRRTATDVAEEIMKISPSLQGVARRGPAQPG